MNSASYKHFLTFSMDHLNEAASTIKPCIDFSGGETIDIEMKEMGRRRIPSGYLSN